MWHPARTMTVGPRVRCLITFDYELFHGRNFGDGEDVLFAPTARIFETCAELQVSATFFPDVCCAWWHREHGELAFAERFEQQMMEAVRRGHDVQLHLHPHWLQCSRVDGGFVFDPGRMYPHELGWGPGDDEAPAVIRRGVQYLERLLKPIDPAYRCKAFRAGSLALQPQEGELLRALWAAGIRLDSSVAKGVLAATDTHRLDYRDVPKRANWFMAPQTGLADAGSGILEVPVGTFQLPRSRRLLFLARRVRSVGRARGGAMARVGRQSRLASLWHLARANLRYLGGKPWFVLSCDTKGFTVDMLVEGLGAFVEDHAHEQEIAVAMLGHPKLMFDEELDLLRGFVRRGRARFGSRLEFVTAAATLAALGEETPASSPS